LEQLFEQIIFEHALGQQPLEAHVFLLEFCEPLRRIDRHPSIGFSPGIEGVFGNRVLAAE